MQYYDKHVLNFLLDNVHNAPALFERPYFHHLDAQSAQLFLSSVEQLADNVCFPTVREMDQQPAIHEGGKIIVHKAVGEYVKHAGDLGLTATIFPLEDGGMQLPSVYHNAAMFILEAANNHLPGYSGLTLGAADLIRTFGSQQLKDTYVPNMIAARWTGTMCLTEPQAGSSLSDVATTAIPVADGYHIEGQKIFISGGDHSYAENFVHLVLARIKGAPPGTRGISLFVVPKYLPDGSENQVETIADFPKLGQKGYCTTHLGFGANGACKGWLVGEPHKGLAYMFQMMNEARIAVGRGAVAITCAAYHASAEYANERRQGRKIKSSGEKDVEEDQVKIASHPDVRRMLMFQKTVYIGGLSLVLQTTTYHDQMKSAASDEDRRRLHLLVEILTPVTKTWPSEHGITSVSQGLQVLGGYGFTTDFILEQYYRDIRIFAIYEGTTGIQSLDLLGRKIPMEQGSALGFLKQEIQKTMDEAPPSHENYVNKLREGIETMDSTLEHLQQYLTRDDHESYLANATVFMQLFGTLVIGWQWLRIGGSAQHTEQQDTYESLMQFYFIHEYPKLFAYAQTLREDDGITIRENRVDHI